MPVPSGVQIDPQTGERVVAAAPTPQASGSVQIDPNTGERIVAAPPTPTQPGNIFTSGHPIDTLRANYDEAMHPYTPQEVKDKGTMDTLLHSVGRGFTGTLLTPFVHPVDFAKGIGEMAVNPVGTGEDMAASTVKDFKDNGALQALPNLFGQIGGGMIGGKIIGGLAPKELPGLTSPVEASARDITKAVSPMQAEAPEFANNVERHWGDLNDYAKRTDNPLRTHQDYVKAAEGAGREALDHYKTQILDPVGYRTAPIDPTTYQGVQAESAPGTASLKDIDSRVGAINAEEKLLKAGDSGDLAAKQRLLGLGTEKGQLLDILHRSLGDLTGNTPEAIQALRQKGPSLLDIGDTMNRADFRRLVTPDAGNVPGSKIGILAKVANEIRGGPVKVADKRLVKAAENAPMQPTPLPGINPPPTALPALNTDFLHANNLEQAAQDASAARAAQAAAARAERAKAFGTDARAATATNAQRVGLPPLNPPEYPMPTPDPAAQAALQTRLAQQEAARVAAAQAQAAEDARIAAQNKQFGERARAKAAENSNRR